jgi:hypothetical protein
VSSLPPPDDAESRYDLSCLEVAADALVSGHVPDESVEKQHLEPRAIDFMVGREGFEPSTIGLKVQKGNFSAFLFYDLPWLYL